MLLKNLENAEFALSPAYLIMAKFQLISDNAKLIFSSAFGKISDTYSFLVIPLSKKI